MSYEIDSSKYQIRQTDKGVQQANDTQSSAVESTVNSLQIFQKTLPNVQESINKLADIDVDELVKKYKKNPIGVVNELGIDFSDKEVEELKSILTNKKELKSFLKLIEANQSLKPGDILGAMRNVKEYAPKNLFGRIGNFFKTLVNEGIDDAIEVAKSETVYYADKLGENMNSVRTERQDFSSDTVVDVSDTMTRQPETKENVMHFVVKENKDGSKLYTEQDVLQARNIIVENIDDANEFTANAAELESIQDNQGNIRYKGSTIITVDEKMIKNKEVKSTMLTVAKKSDMTDEYLINTTSNLAKNHNMADAIEFLATAKDKNGKDKFSAFNVSSESTYLKEKAKEFCDQYTADIKDIVKCSNINGNDAIKITHNTTEHPEIKPQVIEALRNKKNTSEQVVNYAQQLAKKAKNNNSENKTITNTTKTSLQDNIKSSSVQNNVTTTENNSAENKSVTAPIQNTFTAAKSFNNVIVNPSNAFATNSVDSSTQIEKATVINGQVYERSDVLNALTKKYGASAEKVLSAIEKDPGFIDLMKQYNGNQVIINALVEDPYLITKIKKAGGSLSINEIADIVKLCTDATSTDVMLEALQNYSPAEAMKITRKSKIFNMKDDALSILSKSGSSVTSKKNQIEELCFSGGRRTEIIG